MSSKRTKETREKKCIKCGGNEWYRTDYDTGKFHYNCLPCTKENQKKFFNAWIIKHPEFKMEQKAKRPKLSEESLKKNRERYHLNRERYMASNKKWIKENIDKYKKCLEKSRQKERDNLSDNYIRQSIYVTIFNQTKKKIKRKEIPYEMVEKWRQVQIIKRQLKTETNENKKTT